MNKSTYSNQSKAQKPQLGFQEFYGLNSHTSNTFFQNLLKMDLLLLKDWDFTNFNKTSNEEGHEETILQYPKPKKWTKNHDSLIK